jgi:hypothetical protein
VYILIGEAKFDDSAEGKADDAGDEQ